MGVYDRPMPQTTTALLPGTMELLILSVLMAGDSHGYAIARAVERAGGGAIKIEEGSLYPALSRLRRAGMLAASWGVSATGRRARVYAITGPGRRHWAQQHKLWLKFAAAVDGVVSAYT